MDITDLGADNIKITDDDEIVCFAKIGDAVKMTSYKGGSADAEWIKKFYRQACRHWHVQFEKHRYPGVLLGVSSEFKAELTQLDAEVYEDWNAVEQYFILGHDLEDIDWEKLIPYWNNARIFTEKGFLNFLTGDVADNENESDVNWILSQCEFEDGYFKWPHTNVYPSSGNEPLQLDDFPETGLLKFMGYRVGKTNGCPTSERRDILKQVFKEKLPFVDSIEYMQEWGPAQSWYRLKKLSHTIAALARNEKKRVDVDMSVAIQDREDDLAWLKKEYYDTMSFRFRWPKIELERWG